MTTDSPVLRVLALALVTALALGGRPAAAQPIDQIKQLNQDAVTAFGAYSFKKARKQLERALRVAKRNSLLKDPAVAETYMLLGVAHISGSNDLYRGLHYFVRARRMSPKLKIPLNLSTPQLAKMYKIAGKTVKAVGKPPTIQIGEAKKEVAGPRKGPKVKTGGKGLVHSPIENAKRGYPIPVKASTGLDIQAHRVYLFYRPAGTVKFFRIPMKQTGGVYRAAIPAPATRGRYVHYYIEALNQRGRRAASFGHARSPNVIIIN